MSKKKVLMNFAKQKRGMVGLEAAIVLIAFVIIAAVFSFMVVNQGIFATEQGKTVIQQGLQQASSPVAVDGTEYVKTDATNQSQVVGILVPLKTFGSNYVSFFNQTTVVTLKTGTNAWSNIYFGVQNAALGDSFTSMLTTARTTPSNPNDVSASVFIGNSNGDQALDASEKGYLVISLGNTPIDVRSQVTVEVRLESSAPLSLSFSIPASMPVDSWVNI